MGYSRILKKTSPLTNGEDVKELQKRLNDLGFKCGTVDGYYGNNTELAVKGFQSSKKLAVTGAVDKNLWNAIFAKTSGDVRQSASKLILPIHGVEAGYESDTGLDIAAPVGTECYAAANGKIVYSEYGHTKWRTPPDTPNSILIELDEPFVFEGKLCKYIWYTHLSEVKYQVKDGSTPRRVTAGEVIGKSGLGNKNAHLHFGVLVDRAQADANDYLSMNQVRRVLGIKANQRV